MIRLAFIDRDGGHLDEDLIDRVENATSAFTRDQTSDGIDLAESLATRCEEFDAVVIRGGSSSGRLQDTLRAIDAGKHVLVEAPVSASTAEVSEIAGRSSAQGVCLKFGHLDRFRPSICAVNGSLESGELGRPGLLRVHRWMPARTIDDEIRSLVDLAYADIDLACWLFGVGATGSPSEMSHDQFCRPTEVFARQPRTDSLQLHLGFPEGGMALIDVNRTLPAGDTYFSLRCKPPALPVRIALALPFPA